MQWRYNSLAQAIADRSGESEFATDKIVSSGDMFRQAYWLTQTMSSAAVQILGRIESRQPNARILEPRRNPTSQGALSKKIRKHVELGLRSPREIRRLLSNAMNFS